METAIIGHTGYYQNIVTNVFFYVAVMIISQMN